MRARGASRLTSPVTPQSGGHGSTAPCLAVGVLSLHHRTHPLARQVEELLPKLGSVGPFRQSHAVPVKSLVQRRYQFVPYRNTGMQDLMAGLIDLMIDPAVKFCAA